MAAVIKKILVVDMDLIGEYCAHYMFAIKHAEVSICETNHGLHREIADK